MVITLFQTRVLGFPVNASKSGNIVLVAESRKCQ